MCFWKSGLFEIHGFFINFAQNKGFLANGLFGATRLFFIDYYRIDKRGWFDHKANTQLVNTKMKKTEKECTNIC